MPRLKINLPVFFSIALATLATGCQAVNQLQAQTPPESTTADSIPPESTAPSPTQNPAASPTGNTVENKLSPTDAAKVEFAKHLKKIGAKFYGAYWCPYCQKQKDLFGKAAISQINYIECDPKGQKPQTEICKKAKIQGFPTWEIKGKQYPGMMSLKKLADLSGYKGNRNFGN
jgi:protein-disulfide isomerase